MPGYRLEKDFCMDPKPPTCIVRFSPSAREYRYCPMLNVLVMVGSGREPKRDVWYTRVFKWCVPPSKGA